MAAPAISKPALSFFRRIVRRYFRRHFHSVRVIGAQRLVAHSLPHTGPLIVYANHGSWWDPMVAILLAERFTSDRLHFAPMDAASLARYGILKHVGVFPVELQSPRGAVNFLRTGEEILRAGGVLWITPQGRFVDARVRPLEFKPGLAALAVRVAATAGRCTLMPLAIEYPFWDERLPECLLAFGEPVEVKAGEQAERLHTRLPAALEVAMEDLKQRSMRRDPAEFESLGVGTLGIGGFYEFGRKMKALVSRRPYQPEHTLLPTERPDA